MISGHRFRTFALLGAIGLLATGPRTSRAAPLPSPAPDGATVSPSPSALPPMVATAVATVAGRFAGVWRCDGYASEDSSNETYMREAPDVVSLVGTLDSGAPTTERFAFDAVRNLWQLTTSGNATTYAGSLDASSRLVFVATPGPRRPGRATRIVYTQLGPAAFRREHQVARNDGWADDAESVCRRTAIMSASTQPPPLHRTVMAASPTAAPVSGRDRAYHLLGGTWACETIEGNPAPHTYTRASDGSIALHTQLTIGGKSFTIDERYAFDPAPNAWTETTLGNTYRAVAPPWIGDKWTFAGDALVNGRHVPERMIYTDLDGRAFRRDFRQQRGSTWETIASETCKRPA